MKLTPHLSVVLPAYNEADAITKSLVKIEEFLASQDYPWEVLIVNDGSTDKTAANVEALSSEKPNFRLINIEHKGKSFAVRAGMLLASGDYILVTDADLAVPISEVKRFLLWAAEHGNDLVFASREGKGAQRIGEPYYRHLIGRIFNTLVQIILLPGIQDTQCGFRLFTRRAAQELFPKLLVYGENMPIIKKPFFGAFEAEVLFLAKRMGYSIKELPVVWTYSATRRLNFFENSYKMLRDVIKIRVYDVLGRYKV
jgi:glycosyltransferase involved in cell wall biosynthesis